MSKYETLDINLEELNTTELVAMCHWTGMKNASRAWPREFLIYSLTTFIPIDVPGPLDEQRTALSRWLQRWWDRIRMQAPKRVCPECHLCREYQVISCYLKNKNNFA